MKILISGGTGFVGRALIQKLSEKHDLFILVRSMDKAQDLIDSLGTISGSITPVLWTDYYQSIDFSSCPEFDTAINLIGENIGQKKWSNERKKNLYNSRIDSTRTILNSLKIHQSQIDSFISTSAIGIYSDGFLNKLCVAWEKSAQENSSGFAKRLCILRLGMVLGKGGAMDKILPAFKLGLGGKLGGGKQVMSWIHLKDLVNIFEPVIEDSDYSGELNATSSFSVDNNEFTATLGKILRKPTRVAVPEFALKLLMGEMSCLMLDSIKAEPLKLKEKGFHYLYPTIELALKEVVSK